MSHILSRMPMQMPNHTLLVGAQVVTAGASTRHDRKIAAEIDRNTRTRPSDPGVLRSHILDGMRLDERSFGVAGTPATRAMADTRRRREGDVVGRWLHAS